MDLPRREVAPQQQLLFEVYGDAVRSEHLGGDLWMLTWPDGVVQLLTVRDLRIRVLVNETA